MPSGIYKRTPEMKTGRQKKPCSEARKKKLREFNLGKTLSSEHRIKMKNAALLRVREGRHNNYKGGITPEIIRVRNSIEHRLWREAVFARDNWTCQKYGIRGSRLDPHHIRNFSQFPELRFAIDNGVTLSRKAHKEFHKKYGQKNNTAEQLKEFLEID